MSNEIREYLNQLEAKTYNMYKVTQLIEERFGVSHEDAKAILMEWHAYRYTNNHD